MPRKIVYVTFLGDSKNTYKRIGDRQRKVCIGKKNSGISTSNWKNVKIEKTREIKYFINFTKFCFSYKRLTEKKHFIILQYQNSNPH